MLSKIIKTASTTEDQRLVFSEVYAPNRPDSQGEYMRAETILKMAHDFAKAGRFQQIDVEHNNVTVPGIQVVESFIARKGDTDFIEGSWVVGIHVNDDDTWEAIKNGEINGLSLEALVVKEETPVQLSMPPVVSGRTSKSEDHEHQFYVSYNDEGVFQGGVTNTVDGHSHVIKTGTMCEFVNGHSHRFSSVDDLEILPD